MRLIYSLGIVFISFVIWSCTKKEVNPTPPDDPVTLATVITNPVIDITDSSINTSGYITNDGGSFITEKGIVYGIYTLPNLANGNKISSGNGSDSFKIKISGLKPAQNIL